MGAIGKAMAALEADNARLRAGIRRVIEGDVGRTPDPSGRPLFCAHTWLMDDCDACTSDFLLALLDGTVAPPRFGGTSDWGSPAGRDRVG